MKNFNVLTEGRYDPAVDSIEYKILRQHLNETNNTIHLVYTGVLKTCDRYLELETGLILHTIEAHIDGNIDPNDYIVKNRWKQIIESEIANQVSNPRFARYNLSFLNSVHNSAIKTRA